MHFEHDTLLHGGLFELPFLSGERLQVSPSLVGWVNSTWSVTVTVRFIQHDSTPEIPKTFHVYHLAEDASESERLNCDSILELRMENSVAPFSFCATENGTITADGEFRVGLEMQKHGVTSNLIFLICK